MCFSGLHGSMSYANLINRSSAVIWQTFQIHLVFQTGYLLTLQHCPATHSTLVDTELHSRNHSCLRRAHRAAEGGERACNVHRRQNAEYSFQIYLHGIQLVQWRKRNCVILVPPEWLISRLQRPSSTKTYRANCKIEDFSDTEGILLQ